MRSLHPESHENLPQWIENIVTHTCETYEAKCAVNYRRGVPSVQNDLKLTQILEAASRETWGNECVEILPEPSLGAEDFSVYLEKAPGCMFRLGVGYRDRPNYPLHHPKFEIDEASIIIGVVTLAYTAYKYWQQGGKDEA